jgi:plasmid stabilization system protein ParE
LRRLVLLDSGLADLKDIARYIGRASGNRTVGRRFAMALRAQCETLAGLPGTLGRKGPEIQPDLRSFPFNGYVIFFRYRDDVFEVVNIVDGRRDIAAVFPEPPV